MGQPGSGQITSAKGSFVGRERELAELVAACELGADGPTHLFLIFGEPGIGKTRLADEVAARAKAREINVLWGRCWEGDGAPAYWPWIQIIRGFLAALDPERRRAIVESEVPSDTIHEIAQLVPDLRHAQSAPRPPASDRFDPNKARFRLFDALTNFLKIGARGRPMLIILDDIHDADEASLAMLHFFARDLKGVPVVIVATHREAEVRSSPELSKLIGQLSRDGHSIPISGLSETEVKRFIQTMAESAVDDTVATEICAATNGNPLFVDGIVRGLIAESASGTTPAPSGQFKIPVGVREAIRARLSRLSADSNALLMVAASIGKEFDFELCRAVAEVSADEAHRRLDEAARAGIVTALGQGRYQFSHALIRDAAYEELHAEARTILHRAIATRLEKKYRYDLDSHAAELAHHFREANDFEKAIDYSVRAGWATIAVGAFDYAVRQFESALSLMEQSASDRLARAYVLRMLGDISFSIGREKVIRYREAAVALYESLGHFHEAAEVRGRLGRSYAMPSTPFANSAIAIDHLRRAEAVLTKGPETQEVAWLYEGFAAYEHQRLNMPKCAAAALKSMEVSSRIGYELAWAQTAGYLAYTLAQAGQLKEAFELFERAFEAGDQFGTPSAGHCVTVLAGGCLEWLGDPRAARAWYQREMNRPRNAHNPLLQQELSSSISNSYYEEGQIRELARRVGPEDLAIRFWVRGECEGVAELLETVVLAQEQAGDRAGRSLTSYPLGTIYLGVTGEFSRAEPHLKYGLDNGEGGPLLIYEMRARPFLAMAYVEMNRLDEAAEQVARCYEIMSAGEDWRGRVSTVEWAEAVVAAARGNYDLAEQHFESALAVQRKYHLLIDENWMLPYWGRVRAEGGNRIGAAEKFDEATELYRSRGIGSRFIELVRADKERSLGTSPTRVDLGAGRHPDSTKSQADGSFQKEGEFWTIAFVGSTFRLKDAKGLHYIAYLLARPGQRIHVLDLVDAVEGAIPGRWTTGQAASDNLQIVRDPGGPPASIDARARSEYRARLRDLQAELADAEGMNDLGRTERLRAEIETIGGELAGASGFGGRARARSAHAERARGVVRKNVRTVLDKISHEHPGLGRHFSTSISMGYFCVYQPEPSVSWQL
jgi:tetratricopeptide (TPR) repeat protein